jgi:hypothetical protein
VLPTEIFNQIADKLGVSGARYLTEAHGMQTRKYMPQLAGRFSYLTQASGKDIQEIYQIMQKVAPTWAKMLKVVDGKFESNSFYDQKTGNYKYYTANGAIRNLVKDEAGARKAFVESSKNSELEKLGRALLGNSNYEATKGLTA